MTFLLRTEEPTESSVVWYLYLNMEMFVYLCVGSLDNLLTRTDTQDKLTQTIPTSGIKNC